MLPNEIRQAPGVLCTHGTVGYPSATHFKPKSREISFAHNIPNSKVHGAHLGPTGSRWAPCSPWTLLSGSLINFSIVLILTRWCSMQNYKTIGQLIRMLWTNKILRDLNLLRRVSDGYFILHSTPAGQQNWCSRRLSNFTVIEPS